MYCVAARDQEADGRALPAVVPVPRAASTACTRFEFKQKGEVRQDAQRVILTCVGCHLRKKTRGLRGSTKHECRKKSEIRIP